MNHLNRNFNLRSFRNFWGVFAFILILIVTLACSIDLGELGEKDNSSKDKETAEKRPSGKKKKQSKDEEEEEEDTKKTSGKNSDKGDFLAVYSDIQDQKYVAFDKSMRDQKVLEDIANQLNKNLSLPTDVTITFKDCGTPNAFYMADNKLVTVCYEFMDLFYQKFIEMGFSEEEANQRMFGATEFFFLHELGHCLIDVYDLPAVGREEDAVDQLSTYILMDGMSEGGDESAISGVLIFQALAENEQNSPQQFADEHSLSSQRYFNIACWMYGKDPRKYSDFVTKGVLPETRAVRCETEYNKMSNAWKQLVAQHRK
jgi:hypothetical protein